MNYGSKNAAVWYEKCHQRTVSVPLSVKCIQKRTAGGNSGTWDFWYLKMVLARCALA